MSKIDVVRAAMVEAMKAKDKARKDSLSMLLSALKNAEIDKREGFFFLTNKSFVIGSISIV